MPTTDLAALDATAQAELVADGEAVPRSSSSMPRSRAIEATNPAINAVIHPLFDQARERCRRASSPGPFAGVPMVVKDLDGQLAGAPLHRGNKLLKEIGYVRRRELVPLRQARAGRLRDRRQDEHARVRAPDRRPNPRPTARPATRGISTRGAGGSSGGSAAAVAAGHGAGRPRRRRRRLDPHPRERVRPRRPEAVARSRARSGPRTAKRGTVSSRATSSRERCATRPRSSTRSRARCPATPTRHRSRSGRSRRGGHRAPATAHRPAHHRGRGHVRGRPRVRRRGRSRRQDARVARPHGRGRVARGARRRRARRILPDTSWPRTPSGTSRRSVASPVGPRPPTTSSRARGRWPKSGRSLTGAPVHGRHRRSRTHWARRVAVAGGTDGYDLLLTPTLAAPPARARDVEPDGRRSRDGHDPADAVRRVRRGVQRDRPAGDVGAAGRERRRPPDRRPARRRRVPRGPVAPGRRPARTGRPWADRRPAVFAD